jgi:hypothetical protein
VIAKDRRHLDIRPGRIPAQDAEGQQEKEAPTRIQGHSLKLKINTSAYKQISLPSVYVRLIIVHLAD